MVKVYIVRHCPTEGNAVRVFQGGIDTPLSKKGEECKELLSVRFRNIHLDKIYSSPQKRAYLTAEGVALYNKAPIITLDGLKEIHIGEADGKPWQYIAENYRDFAAKWDNEPWLVTSPGGETMAEVYERMKNSFLKAVSESENQTIAIVSHGCALHNLMCYLIFNDIKKLKETDFLNHASVSLLTYDNGEVSFEYYNDNSHIIGAKPVSRPLFYP
ncbi:MAG: histidine phosphatase family protein [Ruminococcaceae bacterium]|nr:histidine phosphatase family protein [Oscillospiraceae bacterium]